MEAQQQLEEVVKERDGLAAQRSAEAALVRSLRLRAESALEQATRWCDEQRERDEERWAGKASESASTK